MLPAWPAKASCDPVLEVDAVVRVAVAVDAAALEEVDHDFMDDVAVATELEGVTAVGGGEDIGELDAVLIGLRDAGQGVGHAEGDDAGGDAGPGSVGAGGFKVAAVLEVDLVDRSLADLGGEAGDEEALVIAGGSVGAGRAVGEGVGAGCSRRCSRSRRSCSRRRHRYGC